MSIATALTALADDVSAAKAAITAKGGTAPNGTADMADAIAAIPSGGIDGLIYSSTTPVLELRYPSENPVIYCPLITSWQDIFRFRSTTKTFPYHTITLKGDLSPTSMYCACWNYEAVSGSSPFFTTLTLDFPSLSGCTQYASMVRDHPNFKELKGTPLDFTSVEAASQSKWISADNIPPTNVKARYKPNTLKVNHDVQKITFTDDTLVSIANGLQSGAHTITLHADMKAKCQSIMGAVSQVTEGDVTYDFFTASSSGTVTLENFITQIKGWTIA